MAWMALGVFSVFLLYAAVRDVASFTIPNWVSGGLAAAFLVFAVFTLSPSAIGQHVMVGLIALGLGAAFFALGWIGGGDAKLFAAIALWLGWTGAGAFLVWTALAGGVLSLVVIGVRRVVSRTEEPGAWTRKLLSTRGGVPYGVALALGGVAAIVLNGPFDVVLPA